MPSTGCSTAGALSCVVTGLTNGKSHVFRVAAVNAKGIGAYTAALLTTQGWPLWSAFLLATALCFVIGWLLGTRLKPERTDSPLATVNLLEAELRQQLAQRDVALTGGPLADDGVAGTMDQVAHHEALVAREAVHGHAAHLGGMAFGYAYLRWFHRRSSRIMVSTSSLERELYSWGFRRMTRW